MIEDLLQNGDFEAPPAKIRVNETNQRAVLSPSNKLSGWEFGGVVEYIKGGGYISLPDNGHGIQLGENGWISQNFRSKPGSLYLLTFTFTAAGTDCWWTPSYLILSVPPHSTVFYLQQRYGHEAWETHAWGFRATSVKTDVKFARQAQTYANISCGPLLAAVYLKEQENLESVSDNILLNGNFEQGPSFYPKSTRGVLLHPVDDGDGEASSLPGWKIQDTVKYIDFDERSRGIEIVSGPTGGIEQSVYLATGVKYVLKFQAGDANNLCYGGLAVGVRGGSSAHNFSYMSYGKGDFMDFSMEFYAFAQLTNFSFVSLYRAETKDLTFCGPVIENVVLVPSQGELKSKASNILAMMLAILLALLGVQSLA
ncbi:protein DUF642 L-GALACTONO-1,4-LACTONE-RESPONSIVE GENE 2 isoform X2 [Cryptomeria japonica]|uniref:protein DUF642 L-GALACTONO-1,4-LACTONE-RESPONSIVE GENE 2 isoform X2 n=1 Tax=Cryptomeria japonica TaxID=3369 RepID=UPI0025AB6369|nr:protein DUF642 L-GALACTONO-1,4-LACTONE-RESPONSIVE GENE 2 isoform X2 [Cryptomeria japonica]